MTSAPFYLEQLRLLYFQQFLPYLRGNASQHSYQPEPGGSKIVTAGSFRVTAMVLSDTEIRTTLGDNQLKIDPYPKDRIGASSVDLLLHPSLRILPSPEEVRGVSIDPKEVRVATLISQQPEHRLDQAGPYKMRHGQVIIGKTLETIELPLNLAGRIEGKSSLARLGLAVHITAPTIQARFRGSLVLEMYNAGPWTLKLTDGIQIAQIIFERLERPPSQGYQGQFQGQR